MKKEDNPPLLYKKKLFPFMSWFKKKWCQAPFSAVMSSS